MNFQLHNIFPEQFDRYQFFKQILRTPGQRRYALKWWFSLADNYLINKGSPWITFDAITFLNKHLPAEPRVFEYGSGGSTIFWQKHNSRLVSVEHDPVWCSIIKNHLGDNMQTDYRLVLPEPDLSLLKEDVSNPEKFSSADVLFENYSFRNYVLQITEFPDSYFDCILIDGRARSSCLYYSLSKIKKGGMIVLDNADREYYTAMLKDKLLKFHCNTFIGVTPAVSFMTRTDIYLRLKG